MESALGRHEWQGNRLTRATFARQADTDTGSGLQGPHEARDAVVSVVDECQLPPMNIDQAPGVVGLKMPRWWTDSA